MGFVRGAKVLEAPANVLDEFVPYEYHQHIEELQQQLQQLHQELKQGRQQLAQAQDEYRHNLEQLHQHLGQAQGVLHQLATLLIPEKFDPGLLALVLRVAAVVRRESLRFPRTFRFVRRLYRTSRFRNVAAATLAGTALQSLQASHDST